MTRWPEPRPPLRVPPVVVLPGTAVPLPRPLHPALPAGVTWLLTADEPVASRHRGPFELELDLRWTRVGCARLFELVLVTRDKRDASGTRARLGTFRHTFHPVDRMALRPLVRLARQPWWWLVVRGPDGVAGAVELENTLDLDGLLRRTWAIGPVR